VSDHRPPVRVAYDRGVAVVTLDSPADRNALTRPLVGALRAALESAGQDPGVRAVLLTHTGNTCCAGASLKGAPPAGPAELTELLGAVVASAKPVVALTTGHVRAGGLGLLAACDVALAGPQATFAFTESRLGLAPAVISLTVLPRMDARAASRYFLTGEVFGPQEAVRTGLVTAGADELEAVLDGLRAASPQGLAESKRLASAPVAAALAAGREEMERLSARLFASAEAAEGIDAFRTRRAPAWQR
jgi:enoyl-CoA hydratase